MSSNRRALRLNPGRFAGKAWCYAALTGAYISLGLCRLFAPAIKQIWGAGVQNATPVKSGEGNIVTFWGDSLYAAAVLRLLMLTGAR